MIMGDNILKMKTNIIQLANIIKALKERKIEVEEYELKFIEDIFTYSENQIRNLTLKQRQFLDRIHGKIRTLG